MSKANRKRQLFYEQRQKERLLAFVKDNLKKDSDIIVRLGLTREVVDELVGWLKQKHDEYQRKPEGIIKREVKGILDKLYKANSVNSSPCLPQQNTPNLDKAYYTRRDFIP